MSTPTHIEAQLGLAGVCQAAALVKQVATGTAVDAQAYESSLSSILVTDANEPIQIFGQVANLTLGWRTLQRQLADSQQKDMDITRYVAGLLALERKLSKDGQLMQSLGERIHHVQRQLAHIAFDNPQIVTALASIYSDLISPLTPKIQVFGNRDLLQQPTQQQRVRALLLAGVRSAVLWRQMGGKRRQLLFRRRQILASATEALKHMY